jgi:hypothetical protein
LVRTNDANMEEAGILEKISRSGFCYPALNQVEISVFLAVFRAIEKKRRRSPVGAPGRGAGGPFYGAQPLQPTQTRAPTGERLRFSSTMTLLNRGTWVDDRFERMVKAGWQDP